MGESASFRRSVNGFNREDVNAYVVAMNRRHAVDNKALLNRIDELTAEVSRLSEDNERLASCQSEQPAPVDCSPELSENITALEEKLTLAENENEELRRQLSALNEKLNNASSSDFSDEDARKILLYEKLSSQVGDILLNASKNADEIVRTAKLEAERISAGEKLRLQHSAGESRAAARVMAEKLTTDVKIGSDSCLKELREYTDSITVATQNMMKDFEMKYAEMQRRIFLYQKSLEEDMKRHLSEFGAE